jgi:hypothetical protein
MRLNTIRAVTDFLLAEYSDFKSAQDYFDAYAVMGSVIADINDPVTVITAADDPIIPVNDFYDLAPNDHLHLVIHPHGGHNGFITGFKLQSWYEAQIVRLFDNIVQPS